MDVNRLVNSFYNSNTYILSEKEYDYAWLIDAGDAWEIISRLNSINKKIGGILLTHTHFDHIYGLNDLFDYDPDIKIYTSSEGKESLFSDKFNLSKYHEKPFVFKGHERNINILKDGWLELWPGIPCSVCPTPGHDLSCLTYGIKEYLFTGDSYIPGKRTVAIFPRSNRNSAAESTNKILSLLRDKKYICPGHGEIALSKTEKNKYNDSAI